MVVASIFNSFININLCGLIIFCVTLCFVSVWVCVKYKIKAREEISKTMIKDPVTGAQNFIGFIEEAQIKLNNSESKVAIGVVDISNFKTINDFYGRSFGDVTLKVISDKLCDIVSPDGIYSRMFADRFVFLIPYMDIDGLAYVIETYLSGVDVEFETIKETINIDCNCGIYKVEDYKEDINGMIDKALVALKISKASVTKMVTVLDIDIGHIIETNQKLTYKMNSALKNHEFVAYIQPKVSFRDGSIVGGEALARWMSPDEGMIAPNDFIPLFEQNGFVTKVDFCILEKICSMIRKRKEWGKRVVPISVNQSRIHVYDKMYINKLITTFDRFGISKDNIIFELTESAFTDNTEDMISLCKRMNQLGYIISMDDFGCGYSSLNMLNILPINELKLDKQFLNDESDKSRFIIKSIINLAHGLGMKVVCEGVETFEQVDFLRKSGCDIAQGFYYSKPVPLPEFEKLLDIGRIDIQ